jgi:hypothetical protein
LSIKDGGYNPANMQQSSHIGIQPSTHTGGFGVILTMM